MSPTYWAASQFKKAVRENGWRFVPTVDGQGPWGARKGCFSVMIKETVKGALSGVWFTYPVTAGMTCDYLGPRHPHKLARVLAFVADPTCRGGILNAAAGCGAPRQRKHAEPDPMLF